MGRTASTFYSVPLESGQWLIYAPLCRVAFVANRAAVNCLAGGADGSPMSEWLRALGLDGAVPEPPPDARACGPPAPTAVTLLLTTACNLRCDYCYAQAGDRAPERMSAETARRGVDFVLANALARGEPGIEVAFHSGGEPTRHWPVLTATVDYARARCSAAGLGLSTALATNGVLSAERTDWIASNLDEASVSCDGLPELQDRFRRLRDGGVRPRR